LFLDVVIIVLAIALIIKSTKPGATVAYLVYGFSALICLFSQLYWGYGTAGNFSIRLSRGDALYFAIGTLTTAGTGNISATSGIAREIQALQMMLDLALLGFAVALAISRLASQAQESSDT
jgi:predicted membrane channel-forming protein YqfA (hemolysin III family)